MALSVIKALDKGPERDTYVKQCLSDLSLPPERYPKKDIQAYIEFRLGQANEHVAMGPAAEETSYSKQLDFINSRIKALGIDNHSRIMLPPVVFSDPAIPVQASFHTLKAGYRLVNNDPRNIEDNHIHEMTHAASKLKVIFKVSGDTIDATSMNGFNLTRNEQTSFSIFNEFAAISMEEDYRRHCGAFNINTKIYKYPFLSKEQKKELLPLSRLVDSEGIPGMQGKLKGLFRRMIKLSGDFSMDYTASVKKRNWIHSDYLTVYTAVNRMLLEVGAMKLGLKHKYELSRKQEKTTLSEYKDEIQKAVFTGSIKKVATDFRDTFGKRALHFLSDIQLNSRANQSHLYLVLLFARAGHIEDPERRSLVREKIMDHYYDSKKATV